MLLACAGFVGGFFYGLDLLDREGGDLPLSELYRQLTESEGTIVVE